MKTNRHLIIAIFLAISLKGETPTTPIQWAAVGILIINVFLACFFLAIELNTKE